MLKTAVFGDSAHPNGCAGIMFEPGIERKTGAIIKPNTKEPDNHLPFGNIAAQQWP
jgi:hypothetical protein